MATGTEAPRRQTAKEEEPRLTRFLAYKTSDKGVTLHLVGEQLARSSDEARRLFFAGDPPVRGDYAFISENAVRIRSREVQTVTKLTHGDPYKVEVPTDAALAEQFEARAK